MRVGGYGLASCGLGWVVFAMRGVRSRGGKGAVLGSRVGGLERLRLSSITRGRRCFGISLCSSLLYQ